MCEGRLGSSFYGNLPTRAPPSSKEAYSILFATCKPFLLTPPLSFYFHRSTLKVAIFVYLFVLMFIYLAVACRFFSCSTWDLVSRPGIKPRPTALGSRSRSRWTTREVFAIMVFNYLKNSVLLGVTLP